jgi:pimeloyl-ACP methyl ester carboxylesterase
LARKFLYVVAGLIVLAIAAAFAWRLFGNDLVRRYMTPSVAFRAQDALPPGAYDNANMWIARPDIARNPALWVPAGQAATDGGAAVFFIHPTSFLATNRWNAPLDDREANDRAAVFLRGQASAFNASGQVWSPRYRQAAFGAFLTTKADAERALDLAYRDVAQAFDAFLAANPDRPLILAGHSQGGLHLTRLLREKVAGTVTARRVVAAYVVGWPVSREADLAALGLAECTRPDQSGCLLSWQTFGEPADPSLILDTFDATTGFDGRSRRGTAMVCTNPLTGMAGGAAPASANLGTLFPAADLTSATMQPGRVGARCEGRGLLMIGEGPDVGPYVLPGNNYHVYDYSLFWANVRADAARRLQAFRAR